VSVIGAELAGTGDSPPSDHYAVVADLGWDDEPAERAAPVSRAAPS
jgi:hypothetical protein